MRITQVVADGRPGGGTVMVLALVEDLAKRGAEVSLVTDAGSYAARQARELGVEVAEIQFFNLFSATRALAAALEGLAPEQVHLHGSRAAHHFSRTGSTIPAHYTVHGYHFEHRSLARRWAGRWAERRLARGFRSVVHVCDYDRALAEKRRLVTPETDRRVIYNGVDATALPAAEPLEPKRVAFVGRLVPQKDSTLIAQVAKRLAADGIPVSVVGGGDGEDDVCRALHSEIAAGTVVMTGEVGRSRALRELAASSVLVQTSRWEGLPVVLLEALAIGVPVVAAAVGGVPEALAGGNAGLLVQERDPDTFAAATKRVLYEGDLSQRLIHSGRELVEERFRLETCLESYLELYS